MAAFQIDDKIKEAIEKTIEIASSEDKDILRHELDCKYLKVKSVKIIKKYEQSTENVDTSTSIINLIRGKKLEYPAFKKEVVQESAEKISRRQKLQNKIDERDYNRMVYGSEQNPADQEILSVSKQLQSVRNQISIGVNMIVAIIATFGICYYIGGSYTSNTSTRMIYGLTGGILVMILEMVLYIIRAGRMEEIEHKVSSGSHKSVNMSVNSRPQCEITSLDVAKDVDQ